MHLQAISVTEMYALVGPMGCGKSTAVKRAMERYPDLRIGHNKFSDPLTKELQSRGHELERRRYDDLVLEWDQIHGPEHLSYQVGRDLQNSVSQLDCRMVFADGVRRPQDVKMLERLFPSYAMIYVDADQRQRWEWITARDERPAEKKTTWEQFQAFEKLTTNRQLHAIGREHAEVTVINNGTFDQFKQHIIAAIENIRKRRGWDF